MLAGKHTFGAIDDQRVTFIEKKITKERLDFLVKLLEHNGYETVVKEEKRKTEEDPQLYTLAVTDMTFNPTIAVYERKLKTLEGKIVNPDYWEQRPTNGSPNYWK